MLRRSVEITEQGLTLSPRRKGEAFRREVRTKGRRDRFYGPRPSTQILERPIATESLHKIPRISRAPIMVVSQNPSVPAGMTTSLPWCGRRAACSGVALPSSDSDQYLLIKLCAVTMGEHTMELLEPLRALIKALGREKREQYHRHVSVGDLLTDRFEIARDYGFGNGTSCYDNVLILGDVTVGKNCWIGPNVILDGSGGGLLIGDYVDISAGVHIYTHNTVNRAISGGVAGVEYAPTRIGSRVYIGPQSVVEKGIAIGDGVVIGAMSLVNRDVPSDSRVWGIPAAPR